MTAVKTCALSVIYTCSVIDSREDIPVGKHRIELGAALGDDPSHTIPDADYIVPVPQSGLYYAMGLSMSLKIPYLQAIVKWNEHMRTLSRTQDRRKKLMNQELLLIPSVLEGKRVILVDEAIFTGLTMKICCEKLRRCGVKEIHVCIPTTPCAHSCPMLPHTDLISARMSNKEMCSYFACDSLTFQSETVFRKMMEEQFGSLCAECFM